MLYTMYMSSTEIKSKERDTMNAKHTPGPWYWRRSMLPERAAFVLGAENVKSNTTVLQVAQAIGGAVPTDADASLISAAPDLLAACKMAQEWMAQQNGSDLGNIGKEAHDKMVEAIAKAEGDNMARVLIYYSPELAPGLPAAWSLYR
jgi:hypothetical protein